MILNFFSSKCYYRNIILENLSDKTMVEREEEQPAIKVTDRRKFNLDGSMREGVEIEAEKPPIAPPLAETPAPLAAAAGEFSLDDDIPDMPAGEAIGEDEEIPGAE